MFLMTLDINKSAHEIKRISCTTIWFNTQERYVLFYFDFFVFIVYLIRLIPICAHRMRMKSLHEANILLHLTFYCWLENSRLPKCAYFCRRIQWYPFLLQRVCVSINISLYYYGHCERLRLQSINHFIIPLLWIHQDIHQFLSVHFFLILCIYSIHFQVSNSICHFLKWISGNMRLKKIYVHIFTIFHGRKKIVATFLCFPQHCFSAYVENFALT